MRRRGRLVGIAAAAWLGLAAGGPTRPSFAQDANVQSSNTLEDLVGRADFAAAERRAQDLLASGKLRRPEVARVYLQLGIVASARRDPAGAEIAFRRALQLDSTLALPSSAGPHVAESFGHARAGLARSAPGGPRASLTRVEGSADVWIDVKTGGTDAGLARQIEVRADGFRQVLPLDGVTPRLRVTLPASLPGCTKVIASLLDEYGNELWPEAGQTGPCLAIAGADAGVRGASTSSRPVPRRVWAGAAATGVLAVTTGVLGAIALDRRGQYHDALDAMATPTNDLGSQHDDAVTAERRATIAFVATVAAGVVTLALALWRR
jgi:hypothetical protein